MKNFLATACALAISVFPAMAADMPLKTLPPPAPFFTWTGCYLGGSLGGLWRTTDNVRIGVVDGGSGVGAAVTAGAIPTAFDSGGLGWIVGGQAGCNYQAASWVIGIETDFSGGHNASATVTTNVPPFSPLTSSSPRT
jgi:outer membrane immunogenic protein